MGKLHRYRFEIGVSVFIAAVVFAVFAGGLRAEFLPFWDDGINICDNPHIRGVNASHLAWMFSDFEHALRYKPLSWLSWALIYELGGLNPLTFHLWNVAVHSLNAVLLFLLLRRLVQVTCSDGNPHPGSWLVIQASAVGAILWAVHPLRVEPVVWATGLPYEQSLFWLLGSLLCYLMTDGPPSSNSPRFRWYGLALICFLFSLLSFPIALTAAAIFPVLDIYVLKRFPVRDHRWTNPEARKVWLEKAPFFLASAILVAATLYGRIFLAGGWDKTPSLENFGLLSRTMQAFYIWAYYLWKPWHPFGLSPLYDTLVVFDPLSPPFLASAALVLGVTALSYWGRKRWPAVWVLWLCHLILLVPVLGLTERPHFPSDRYGILSGILLAVAVTALLVRLGRHRVVLMVAGACCVALAVLLAALTVRQVRFWHDSEGFFRHILVQLGDTPQASDIYSRLAMNYESQGKLPQALAAFQKSIRLAPRFEEPRLNLGDAFLRSARLAEAISCYETALSLDTNSFRARYHLAIALNAAGRTSEALHQFQAALQLNPGHAEAHHQAALLLAAQKLFDEAGIHFSAALRLEPANPVFHHNYGVSLQEMGKSAEAAQQLEQARRLGYRASP